MPFPRLLDDSIDVNVVVGEQRISADSHMTEPPDLWQRLPTNMRDQAPTWAPGGRGFRMDLRTGGWDPHERLKDLAYGGVSAEVLYPTQANKAYWVEDHAVEEACFRAYNDWLIEFCSVAPHRFWGLGLISLWDIDPAVKELERCKRAGLRGAAIGLVPPESLPYSSDHYEPFWAAAEQLAMSVNLHINSGINAFRKSGRSGMLPDQVHKFDQQKAVGEIVAGGALERHPGLNVVIAEAGAGWLPFFAQEFDYYGTTFTGTQGTVPRRPADYIERQVYAAFISDRVAGQLLPTYGQDTWMWSTDYPHPACTWPESDRSIASDLGHLDREVRAKVICTNAARLYNDGQLPPPADPPSEDMQDLSAWNQEHWG